MIAKHRKSLFAAAIAATVLGAWGIDAINAQQQPAFTRATLQTRDLSVPGSVTVVARAEFAPGAAAGKHTHPGEELGDVQEGTLVLEIEGQPPVTLKAGDVFFVPAGVVHDGRNTGSGVAKVLATYVVERGKPVATPVK